MSRLPVLRPRQVVAALKKAGFVEHHQRGSHLYLRHPETNRITSIPIHPKDIKLGTLRAIMKQAGLSQEEFERLL